MISTAFLFLVVLDFWSVSPGLLPIIRTPDVYQWLAKEAGDLFIAEYPLMPSDEASFYQYAFWQRVHKKRMVNGAQRHS